jgi:hypothetical protein
MRIAVMIIALAVSLILLLQSCAVGVGGSLQGTESLKEGAAIGVMLAFCYIVGAAFVIKLPIISIVVFAFGAVIAISTGYNSGFTDLKVWGWLAAIFAVLSYFGHREKKRKLQPEFASNVPPILKNEPTAATQIVTGSAMADEKPSPAKTAHMKPTSIVATACVLGFIAFAIVFFFSNPSPTPPGSTAANAIAPVAAPVAQSFSAGSLSRSDLPTVVSTYRDNEMRFKRDFVGRQFSDVLPFKSAKENLIIKGRYMVGFGKGNLTSDVDCTVTSPVEISTIANWNKGDQIRIEGVVKDVTLGSVQLDQCRLSK